MIVCQVAPIATSEPRRQQELTDIEHSLVHGFEGRPARTAGTLRVAARAYGRCMRRLGLAPEQLVIALKQLLATHGAAGLGLQVFEEEPASGSPVTTTYGRLLAWCLDGSFAGVSTRE